MLKPKKCEMCYHIYFPSVSNQRFCGSDRQHRGCSWKRRQQYMKQWGREWRESHPGENSKRFREYVRKNPHKVRLWSKTHYDLNREEILEKQKHNEKRKRYQKTYRSSEKGKIARIKWLKRYPNYYREYQRKDQLSDQKL